MNRLSVRLTLAFGLVILVTVATVATLTSWSVGNQFRQYLMRPDIWPRRGLADALAVYYEQNDSWGNVAQWLDEPPGPGHQRRSPMFRHPPLLLANAQGRVIYNDRQTRVGDNLSTTEEQNAQAITVDGQVVGYVMLTPPEVVNLDQPELNFLARLRISLLVAALIAGVLGIVLGIFMSRMLSTPLATLARTARAFAAHDWNQRVSIQSKTAIVEVAEVAHAFNDMADELQRADIQRRNMMADIAHELRTPLSVIQSNLHALLDGVYPLEMKEIGTLYDETRLLARLVDDLRELTLAEAHQLPLNMRAVDGRELLRVVAAKFALVADTQNVKLQTNIPDALPPLQADSDRMAQVLQNLLTNALRHTPEGGQVTLTADATVKPGYVEFSVKDTGEGIPTEDLPYVFERFYRADKSRARRSGGTGLGLTIAKSLIQAMNGAIGVASNVGEGSRFWFTLPVSKEG
ncbi:MAG: ATP-binding protein [Caldilineaceae bacterium]